MYDSPRTKLIKSVFDNDNNFLKFKKLCSEYEAGTSIPKIYDRELRDHYNSLKKEFRKLFKAYNDNVAIDFENKILIEKISDILDQAIKNFAEKFTKNRMSPNKLNPVIIAREVSSNYMSKIEEFIGNQSNVFSENLRDVSSQLISN